MQKIIIDLEIFTNYFLVGWYDIEKKKAYSFLHTDLPALSKWIEKNHPYFIGFNSQHFDLRILKYALANYSRPNLLKELKCFSDFIIVGNDKINKEVFSRYWWNEPQLDVKQVLGGRNCPSLKKLAYRLRLPELETLPIPPDAILTEEQKEQIRLYNIVDLKNTLHVYNYCQEAIALRQNLSKMYNLDLMSSSDAQISEKVLAGKSGFAPAFESHTRPMSVAINGYAFQSNQLRNFYGRLMKMSLGFTKKYNPIKKTMVWKKLFVENGEEPKSFVLKDIIPNCEFAMGGLHSRHYHYEESIGGWEVDVASCYPAIILKHHIFDDKYDKTYLDIMNKRLAAKKEGRKTEADSLKIVLNSAYGHLSNFYSKLHNPLGSAQVCLRGQLSLLRLIDLCWANNVNVLMANTDGIITKQDPAKAVIAWQDEMNMVLETKEIARYFLKDSNNHILAYKDGSVKIKGSAFAYEKSISRSSGYPIINKSICDYLLNGTPIEQTIGDCDDVYMYLGCYSAGGTIEQVKLAKSPADPGIDLPKVIRYYLGVGNENNIYRKNIKSWLRVADTDGAVLCNKVTGFPSDLNVKIYARKAQAKLQKIRG